MQTITLKPTVIQPQACTIHIGLGAITQISDLYDVSSYSKIFIVTDENVAPLLLSTLTTSLPTGAGSIILPAGENHKTIDAVQTIWTALHAAGADRKSLVINLGGGVIGDLGGFAAATYMRGIAFLNVPTTLLSQVDSGIGGKNGCNFGGVKNLVGTFAQPLGSVIDPTTLTTISERQLLSGFAEIIKHGLISDTTYFEQVTSKKPTEYSQEEMIDIITRSCQIKADIVENDTLEAGPRKLVNFGHTIGHAIEALSQETARPLLHGEAISIGMVAEARISQCQGLLAESDVESIKQAFIHAGLPVQITGLESETIIDKTRSDKKNEDGQLNFTLLSAIGSAVYDQHVDESVVRQTLQSLVDVGA